MTSIKFFNPLLPLPDTDKKRGKLDELTPRALRYTEKLIAFLTVPATAEGSAFFPLSGLVDFNRPTHPLRAV
jgi:hypothetical protein